MPMQFRVAAAVLALTTLPISAQAAIVTYRFTSSINMMFEHDALTGTNTFVPSSSLPGARIAVGDVVSGRFAYDTAAAAPFDGNGSSDGYLVYSRAVTAFEFTVATTAYTYSGEFGVGSSLVVADNSTNPLGMDGFSPYSWAAYDPAILRTAEITLFDRTGSALDGFDIPVSLSLSDFSYTNLHFAWLRRSDGAQFHFNGAVTSLTRENQIPEPTTLALLAVSLALLPMASRRRRRAL